MAEEKDKKATEATDAKATEAKAEKKPAAKKPAAKKPAAKKPAAEAAEKKPAAKKPAAKKPAAKKDDAEAKSEDAAEKKSASETSEKKAPAKKAGTRAKKAPAKETIVEPTLVKATARFVRTAPRKARLVVDHIRGESVEDARVFLQFTARHAGRDVAKVLESAIANAEHNHELSGDELHVVKAFVDEGPTLKRWRPRAKGRATQILKRTSHITVVVSDVPAKEISQRKAAA